MPAQSDPSSPSSCFTVNASCLIALIPSSMGVFVGYSVIAKDALRAASISLVNRVAIGSDGQAKVVTLCFGFSLSIETQMDLFGDVCRKASDFISFETR